MKMIVDKLVHLMEFLIQTKNDRMTLEADESMIANCHMYVSFAVHPDMWSHTGICLTFAR